LLADGEPADAEAVYREDLRRNPDNGWAWFGLSQALAAQKRDSEAEAARRRFEKAWSKADIQLASSAF
jgi:cytochrome c-type biogenesis protein CcmH/NrfG